MFTKIVIFIREFVNFNNFISTLHPWRQAQSTAYHGMKNLHSVLIMQLRAQKKFKKFFENT